MKKLELKYSDSEMLSITISVTVYLNKFCRNIDHIFNKITGSNTLFSRHSYKDQHCIQRSPRSHFKAVLSSAVRLTLQGFKN